MKEKPEERLSLMSPLKTTGEGRYRAGKFILTSVAMDTTNKRYGNEFLLTHESHDGVYGEAGRNKTEDGQNFYPIFNINPQIQFLMTPPPDQVFTEVCG